VVQEVLIKWWVGLQSRVTLLGPPWKSSRKGMGGEEREGGTPIGVCLGGKKNGPLQRRGPPSARRKDERDGRREDPCKERGGTTPLNHKEVKKKQ